MRIPFAFLVMVAAPVWAADNGSQELLQAPRVKRYVSLSLSDDGKAIEYTFDDQRLEAQANPDVPASAVGNGNIGFVVANYNPILMKIKLNDEKVEDASFAAVSGALSDIRKGLGAEAVTAESSSATAAGTTGTTLSAAVQLGRLQQVLSGEAVCSPRAAAEKISRFQLEITAATPSAQQVADWALSAVGRKGIKKAAVTIHEALTKVKDGKGKDAKGEDGLAEHLKEATRLQQELEAWASETEALEKASLGQPAQQKAAEAIKKLGGDCDSNAYALINLFRRTAPVAQLERVSALHKLLEGWATRLAKVASDPQKWVTRNFNRGEAFLFATRITQPSQVTLTTVSISSRVPHLDGETLHLEEGEDSASMTVRLRQRSLFAFEVVPSLVYSFIQEPVYEVRDGHVASAGTKEREFKGAAMLNALCRCWGATSLYPMFQFGLGPDHAVPTFFVGAGFRFLNPNGLSFSFGASVTRIKDLNGLAVGDMIDNQADLDAKLKERSVIKPYFAVQFKF